MVACLPSLLSSLSVPQFDMQETVWAQIILKVGKNNSEIDADDDDDDSNGQMCFKDCTECHCSMVNWYLGLSSKSRWTKGRKSHLWWRDKLLLELSRFQMYAILCIHLKKKLKLYIFSRPPLWPWLSWQLCWRCPWAKWRAPSLASSFASTSRCKEIDGWCPLPI